MATLEAVNEKYFHISMRSWRLLTDFLFDECADLIKDGEKQGWHENYGKMISRETAIAIADRLDRLIAEGVVEQHVIELSIIRMESYFSVEILKRFVQFCRGSGGFDIW